MLVLDSRSVQKVRMCTKRVLSVRAYFLEMRHFRVGGTSTHFGVNDF